MGERTPENYSFAILMSVLYYNKYFDATTFS